MRPQTILGVIFAVAGVAHFVKPSAFQQIVPSQLPGAREFVYASGVAELACAYGLIRRRGWAPWASAVLLVAVFPGNIQMAVDAWQDERSILYKTVTLARLPLQALLVAMAFDRPQRPTRPLVRRSF